MYNAYRHIAAAVCTIAAASLISSCGGSADNKGAEAKIAFDKAQNALNRGDAQECVTMLDSIDRKFASDTEIIKESMRLRPKALLQITDADIMSADSAINTNKTLLDSLKPLMIHVAVPGTEGYLLRQTMVDPSFMNKTGVSPRVSETGEFYIVSSVNPAGGLHHWSVTAVVGNMSATTDTVPYDGTLNFRTNNSEVITFTPSASRAIGALVADNTNLPVKIIFNGQNGRSHSATLNATQVDGIATAYRYACAVNDMRNATINLERLNSRKAKLQQQIDSDGSETQINLNTDQRNN